MHCRRRDNSRIVRRRRQDDSGGVKKMRKIRVDHLLAGTVLALIASTPATNVWAAPDRVESTLPPPPALNSRHIIHRDTTPSAPPPAYNSRAQVPARVEPARIE